MNEKDKIVVLGLDAVLQKIIRYQQVGVDLGYSYINFTSDVYSNSHDFEAQHIEIHSLRNYWSRILAPLEFLIKSRNKIHHAELYPGGRLTAYYALLLRFLLIPFVVVERGDVGSISNANMMHRISMKVAYKIANIIWFKEPYMQKILRKYNNRVVQIENFIKTSPTCSESKSGYFLWCNRIIPERNFEWVLSAAKEGAFPLGSKLVILGASEEQKKSLDVEIKTINSIEISCHEFVDPTPFYREARFFLLPSSLVFGNNSLLESMSYGAIPIVSDIEHSEKVVPNDEVGFRFSHNYDSFKKALSQAGQLSNKDVERMSSKCIAHVESDFSETSFRKKIKKLYDFLHQGKNPYSQAIYDIKP